MMLCGFSGIFGVAVVFLFGVFFGGVSFLN